MKGDRGSTGGEQGGGEDGGTGGSVATGGRGGSGGGIAGTGGAPPRDAGAGGSDEPRDSGSGGAAGAPGKDGGGGAGGGGDGPVAEAKCARMVPVNTPAALDGALGAVKPGDCILVDDGQYPGIAITAKGTAGAPIVIRAAHRLKAAFTSNVTYSKAEWVTVEGFVLPGVRITDSLNCRLSRCSAKPGGGLTVDGTSDHARIDHCDIGGASTPTDVMHPGGLSTNTLIDHNYFHDLHAPHTITLGCCGATYDYHETGNIAEFNLFANCMSGAELFSVKSSKSTIRYNTVRNSAGDIDIRAGRNNSIYGNYVFNGAGNFGIRMYEDGHRIYNNYVESGRAIAVGPWHEGHAQVKDAIIAFNTFIGRVSMGDDANTLFANNIVVGNVTISAGLAGPGQINPTYKDNIRWMGTGPMAGFALVDPKLARVGDAQVPAAGSPAAGAATTAFPFITDDITGAPRGAKADIGANQFSATPGPRRPLTTADVGPDAP